ncbi:MAG: hypothetical protein AAF541_12205 [Pseudomonadota bacterium]
MNWDAIGAVGEVLGAVGVIVTLVYLALQIRQNSLTTRAEIRQSLAEQQIQFINSRATDPFLRGAIDKVYSGDPLTGEEAFGVHSHCLAHVRLFENYFAQYKLGSMEVGDWAAMRKLISRHLSLDPYRNAFESVRTTCNADFVHEVDQILEEDSGRL